MDDAQDSFAPEDGRARRAPLDPRVIRPDARQRLHRRLAPMGGRLGGGFRLMVVSSMATLAVIMLLPLAMGLPAKTDPWLISSIAEGNVNVTFVDRNGDVLAHRGYRQEETVPLAEMPPYLVAAVIAIEDKRFHDHAGIDMRGVARAAYANFVANRIVEGASTITQQLARNLYLDPSRSFARKAQEVALAVWLEMHFTKDEILELYLNRIYLGAGAYGVEAASRVYFNKSARDLTLAEAALIAGLPKAPSHLSPANNLERAHARARLVLDKLEEGGAVDAAAIAEARANPAVIAPETRERNMSAAYFLDWVFSRLDMWIDGPPRELVVETTIDMETQYKAEAALEATLADLPAGISIDQGAIVAMDHDGAVRAMVGGRDYLTSQFNRATQAVRQPGSAFKPIVYHAALTHTDLTPYSGIRDKPVRIGEWRPLNANRRYMGWMQVRNALAYSVNTVAVQLGQKAGFDNVVAAAREAGITTPLEPHPSIALGAMGTKLVELTGAYVGFANGGYWALPHGITRIRSVDGDVLYERRQPVIGVMPQPYRETDAGEPIAPKDGAGDVPIRARIMTRDDSEDMTAMLKRVIQFGTGTRASLSPRDAAGKTGTTNDNRDALFVGYTAQLVAGVWLGNDDYADMGKVYGGTLPAETWASFMTAAHEGLPYERLKRRQFWVKPPEEEPTEEELEAEAEAKLAKAETRREMHLFLNELAGELSSAVALHPPVAEASTPSHRRGHRSARRNWYD